jgi:hypothetical protein
MAENKRTQHITIWGASAWSVEAASGDRAACPQVVPTSTSPACPAGQPAYPEDSTTPEALYLDLLKRCLTRTAFPDRYRPLDLVARAANEPRRMNRK